MARKTHRPLTVAALLLALFMAAMEMTVVSTAMPTVVAELGGALHYAWVFSAYMLTSTVMVPIYGKLADLHGRKPVLLVAIALFLLGSMASGQARSMDQLILFRAIQGLGAGGMQPIAITIVGDIFSLEERAKMQGIFGAVWAIAGLAGPLVGGIIVGALSWRWVFYVNVPFGLLSAIIVSSSLVEDVETREHPLDIAGAVLLAAAVLALLFGAGGTAPALLVPASAVLLAAFVAVERRAKEPLLPLRLFATRVLATTSVIYVLSGAAMIGFVTFVPLFAQGVLGTSPTQAGAAIAPMAVGWPIASAISGRLITRFGFRALVRAGMSTVAVSTAALVWLLGRDPSTHSIQIVAACFGIGMGLSNTALVIAVQSSVGFSQRGVATASTMFFRNIGGTLGVGVMGVVLARALLASDAAQRAGGTQLVAQILGPERRSVDAAVLASISADLASGIRDVSVMVLGLGLAAALVAFAFPKVSTAQAP